MAKITIAGDAVVITSSMKLTDLEKIKKYKPKALILMGGDEGKTPVFGIDVTPGSAGKVNGISVNFGKATNDQAGLASVTLVTDFPKGVDPKDYVADTVGPVVANLNKLEDTLPAVLEEIDRDLAAIRSTITVAQ